MTTTRDVAPAGADTARSEHRARGVENPRRLAEWLAGWRISLRMARRDIARHRGRSVLVAIMVGLPVVIMVAGMAILSTYHISVRESVPARMGSAQAVLAGQTPAVKVPGDPLSTQMTVHCEMGSSSSTIDGSWGVAQRPPPCGDGTTPEDVPPPATPIPSLSRAASLPAAMAALTSVTGSRLVPAAWDGLEVRVGKRVDVANVLFVDGADPAVRGMVDLTSGRWPAKPGEFVVTDAGQRFGLPSEGSFEYTPQATEPATQTPARATGAIVGTARAAAADQPVQLVTTPPVKLAGTQFLLDRAEPVTWSDVTRLNGYGITLLSRDVVEHPDQVPSSQESGAFVPRAIDLTAVTLLCLALLIESCLLAGPAFAVIAQRQRYSLALAAANGATRSQLRRTLLAQALVLGVAAAIAGTVLGILAAAAWFPLTRRWNESGSGPFEVPLLESGIVVACAILAAVVSALIPARGLTRLDVVAALRGDVVSARPHRGLPLLGALLAVGGGAVLVAAVLYVARLAEYPSALAVTVVFAGGLALVVGALCLVPSALALLGRLTARMPVPVRMATRDAARQRGRAIPTVAAIMAGAILLAGFGIFGTTIDAFMRSSYVPRAPMGSAIVYGDSERPDGATRATIAEVIPGATVRTVGAIGLAPGQETEPPPGGVERSVRNAPVLVFGASGCPVAQLVEREGYGSPGASGCPSIVVSSVTGSGGEIMLLSPEDLSALHGADAHAEQTLRSGGVVVDNAALVSGGGLTVIEGKADAEAGSVTWKGETGRRTLPAYVAPALFPDGADAPGLVTNSRIVLTPKTAAGLGAEVFTDRLVVSSPTGEVTGEQQSALRDALVLPYAEAVYVERGYESPIRIWLLVAFVSVALLILIATLTSTALSMGEARRDLATLAAVGAPDSIRRRMAAVQAGVLALIGTVLGLVVGAVPAAALGWVSTARHDQHGQLVEGGFVLVPWLLVAASVVGMPLLTAALAAAFVRVRPDMTRRMG